MSMKKEGPLHTSALAIHSCFYISGVEAMDASGGEFPVLEVADPQRQESLQRENVPDPLAGEQTWPTQEVGL